LARAVMAVVLSWNGREDTLACLRSLKSENVDSIVVDNASSDGSADAVAREFPHAELIRSERNLGYAGGMNAGIRLALERGADAVFLLNNDVEVETGVVAALVAEANGVGAVCPLITFANAPEKVWYAGASFDPWRGYNGRHRGFGQPAATFTETVRTNRACGAAMLIPRQALEQVGEFDEQLFAYQEDTDWSLRARAAGLPILVEPSARVQHKVSAATGGEGSPTALYYGVRNTLEVCERHAPLGRLGTWRRRLVVLAAYTAQALLASRRRAALRGVFDGLCDFRGRRFGARVSTSSSSVTRSH
jgi:GT2 family glycosyltransferase